MSNYGRWIGSSQQHKERIGKLKGKLNRFFHRLLSQTRIHPWASGALLFPFVFGLGLLIGYLTPGPRGWTSVFDRAGIYAGWASIASAWTIWLLSLAKKREARLTFRNAGSIVSEVRDAFDASLILASAHGQPEWHIRHIQPEHVEFLWTSFNKQQTGELIEKFENIQNAHGPGSRDSWKLENAYDMKEAIEFTKRLLHSILAKGIPARRICVDITSGTGVMSLAAFQAAEEIGITSIFLVGAKGDTLGNLIIDEKNLADEGAAKVLLLSDHRKPQESPK